MEKYRVGVIGGTGMVGQRFVTLSGEPPLVPADRHRGQQPAAAGKTY